MPLAELIALITPPACAACRAPLADARGLLCTTCLRALPWLGPQCCRRCAQPSHRGGNCPAARAAFASAWAPLAYEGTALALMRALKFRGALQLAGLMAAQMAANAPPWALAGVTAVVPAPAAPARRRARGFDPAGLLARELAARLDLPVAGCLERSGRASRQLGARRSERTAPGRIGAVASGAAPERPLLVDDVHTTGATLAACARVLTDAGATTVRALSYARAL